MWNVMWFKNDLHVVPKNDVRQHRLFGCWCKPRFEESRLALSPVWIHNAADRREAQEKKTAARAGAEKLC